MTDTPLRFGVFLAPFHALDENPTLALDRDMQLIEQIDRLGFDEVWIGEHHSGGFEIISSPEIFIAAAAERTRHIRLGTGVKSLPYHNPMIIADALVQLDHMTRGRVMFGVGPGALPTDAHQMGVDPTEQRQRMGEALDVIVPLLRGESVTHDAGWFRLENAKLHMLPFTRPMMEMAVTSVVSPAGAIAAGRHGAGLLVLGGISDKSLAHHVDNWRICEQTAAQHGQTVDRSKWRIAVNVHLAESREQARADLAFGFERWIGYGHDVLPADPVPRGLDDPVSWAIDNQYAIFGTPDDAIAGIERVEKTLGGFGVMMLFAHNWANWEAVQRSNELFARHVIPHFTDALGARRESYAAAREKNVEYTKQVAQAVADAKDAYEGEGKN